MTDDEQDPQPKLNTTQVTNAFKPRWVILPAVLVANFILTLLLSDAPTGESIGSGLAPVLWATLVGSIVWLFRGRQRGTFASAFFWIALVLAGISLLRLLPRLVS